MKKESKRKYLDMVQEVSGIIYQIFIIAKGLLQFLTVI